MYKSRGVGAIMQITADISCMRIEDLSKVDMRRNVEL